MKAIGYIRVSTEEQAQDLDLTTDVEKLQQQLAFLEKIETDDAGNAIPQDELHSDGIPIVECESTENGYQRRQNRKLFLNPSLLTP